MRLLALAPLLAACNLAPVAGGTCFEDEDCIRGEICARDSVCRPTAEVRSLMVTWTLKGVAASRASCAAHPRLTIEFEGASPLNYAPVPCEVGQFFMDKLPPEMSRVEMYDYYMGYVEGSGTAAIGDATEVALDLPY